MARELEGVVSIPTKHMLQQLNIEGVEEGQCSITDRPKRTHPGAHPGFSQGGRAKMFSIYAV